MLEKGRVIRKFAGASLVMLFCSFLLFLYPLIRSGSGEIVLGVAICSIINAAVALSYFSLIMYAYDRSNTAFLIALFGGMLVKMVLLAFLLIVLVLSFKTTYLWIILMFMVYYFAFQILEIVFFIRYFKIVGETE